MHTAEVVIAQLMTRRPARICSHQSGSAMIFTGRITGPTYEGYHKVGFRPVNLECHNLTEREGMERFSQVYSLDFKSLH